MRVLVQILSETFFVLRRTERDIIINVHRSSCQVPNFLARLQLNLRFPDIFSKNTRISNFKKIHPVGAELFRADGRTDRRTGMTELIVAFFFAILQRT